MKLIKYFLEFIFITALLIIFKFIGYKNASNLGEKLGVLIGPFFRSKKKILDNLRNSNIGKSDQEREGIIKNMWGNYGRILAEYPFLEKFKKNKLNQFLKIEGAEYLTEVIKNKKQAVFISGHFNNFELMAMEIEKSNINLAAIYRPLNNFFLNGIMENIRKKHICKMQIKKGKNGTRELLRLFKNGYSVALMIDQRVSEGLQINLFNRKCFTTTIPAQLVKKYNCEIIPVYVEREDKVNFKIHFYKPLIFEDSSSIEDITWELNKVLEKMILKNPGQWIWSHNRWK